MASASAKPYDVIVIGLGVMGASALSSGARAGARALGIDQYSPPHSRGSSHGETRLLRIAYAEGAAYVPMMQRAVAGWRALEQRTGKDLFSQCGVTYLAPRGSDLLASVEHSARAHSLALEDARMPLDRTALFNVPKDWTALFEPGAGFLKAEESVAAFLADATACGAALQLNTPVLSIERGAGGVRLATAGGVFTASRVICCIGAWARGEFAFLARLLKLEQHVLHWYEAPPEFDLAQGFTPFVVAPQKDQFLYGFSRTGSGVKLADHYCGAPLSSPTALGSRIPASEFSHVDALAKSLMPKLGSRLNFKPCIYGLSPDEHFILDEHPDLPGVFFLAGLSGHGFKFASVLGEALANKALARPQNIDADFFSLKRFA